MATGPSKKRGGISIDFSGVESGGSRAIPEGDYLLQVVSIEEKESQEGNAYLGWKWKVAEGSYKGATVYDNTSLKPTALWRLKQLMECMGFDKLDGKRSLNLDEFKNKTVMASIINETYQGKEKPRISGFMYPEAGAVSDSKSDIVGKKVTFPYEGETLSGEVVSYSSGKVVVKLEYEGTVEEWEMNYSEVTVA